MSPMRIGHGYDVHRLTEGRRLILGGVEIPWEKGLLGHSDADVLTHAVMDALLGAAGLGDIGRHFPDSDPAYAGADSLALLDRVVSLLRARGWRAAARTARLSCGASTGCTVWGLTWPDCRREGCAWARMCPTACWAGRPWRRESGKS